MSQTPSPAQGLQSCPSTQILAQKSNLPGMCSQPGTETETLLSLGGFWLWQGTPFSPRSQLLVLTAAHTPAGVILGEEMQESQLFPGAGECVAGWPEESAPGMLCQGAQQEKKDPCDAGFSARAPNGANHMAQVASPSPPGPPQLAGCRRSSTVTPSLPATPCSAPALAASLLTPKHPNSTQPQQIHCGKQGRKRKIPEQERTRGCPTLSLRPVPRQKGCPALS